MTIPEGLLAVDPGIDRCGVALFEAGVLTRADHVGDPMPASTDVLERVVRTTAAVNLWISDYFEARGALDLLVVEWPQIHMPGKSKGPGRDVVLVAAVAAAVATRLYAKQRRSVRPDEWKGQLVDPVVVSRVSARLSPEELRVLELAYENVPPSRRHNVTDAIGVGLFATGRFKHV